MISPMHSSLSIKVRKRFGALVLICGVLLCMSAGLGFGVAVINPPRDPGNLELMSVIALVVGMLAAVMGNWIVYRARNAGRSS
jgi:hypothetical protein